MENLFDFVRFVCSKFQGISDFFWEFPANSDFYASIPILGNFPFSILLLMGSGIYFSVALGFIQFKSVKIAVCILFRKKEVKQGISPLSSFLLSTAMRVGPGNILGVTGAISTGGPGALFWMWGSAFFGMATSFIEATLSQIFKVKKGDQYLGGFSYYGKGLVKNSVAFGICLSALYVLYSFLILPTEAIATVSLVGEIARLVCKRTIEMNSMTYWIASIVLIVITFFCTFSGIKFIVNQVNRLVPSMVILYIFMVLVITCMNIDRVPWFFYAVFTEAFKPEAIFGGSFGIVLSQGIKRGLMSNEAGQGTITMAAATSEVEHPCEQGYIQSFGVFVDTMMICTLTGFLVVMAKVWQTDIEWLKLGEMSKITASVKELLPNPMMNLIVNITISCCLGLFAFTTLLGIVSFSEICANLISQKQFFLNSVRFLSVLLVSFGLIANLAGLDLSDLWKLDDLADITLIYINVPILYVGFKYVKKAKKHYDRVDREKFISSRVIGINTPTWDE